MLDIHRRGNPRKKKIRERFIRCEGNICVFTYELFFFPRENIKIILYETSFNGRVAVKYYNINVISLYFRDFRLRFAIQMAVDYPWILTACTNLLSRHRKKIFACKSDSRSALISILNPEVTNSISTMTLLLILALSYVSTGQAGISFQALILAEGGGRREREGKRGGSVS